MVSEFTGFRHLTRIVPETLKHGILPPEFCRKMQVLPLQLTSGTHSLAFGNPFDYELVTALERINLISGHSDIQVADPATILFTLSSREGRDSGQRPSEEGRAPARQQIMAGMDVPKLCDHILESAVRMRASDIHIEPLNSTCNVRFRIDGDLHDFLGIDNSGSRLVSRFKLIAQADIAEQRKPQDGSLEMTILGTRFSLRIATNPTPAGEGVNIRLLETDSGLRTLLELGMTTAQEQKVTSLARRNSGMILFVGPTGSGKTTSIYSLLSHIDCEKRCLVSVEDPIEYRIPRAIQHSVNQRAGVTFESLLKASVRQDPDILFIGEIRDPSSARIAMDFTSTGHFTISSLHTVNAVTAVFRLERLGITRDVMAESLLAVVAQRLVKRLCPECKEIGEARADDLAIMRRFVASPPRDRGTPQRVRLLQPYRLLRQDRCL